MIRLSKYGMLKIMGIAVIGEGTTLRCVEGLSSVVTKSFREAKVLLGGVPAKKIAENVELKK